ncbi:LysR family transcriptional regulator [Peredibacter starrii]|uniref:LysR substrate-binding domain-containing protein n=1 Tax=Peredibacter starrii TaxID=28202 RepID=A0AAX4HJS7_9BACT|nr:LysR substrate-binding domain-containing protein [Peredibacter starrii]WPU63501.1 LysR substrate-binding domain-containing protein [Peredibacter starrii]
METIKWVQGVIAFVKVAETGSFSRAAKSLGVSKSHISKTIRQLEEDLGIALFLRSTRKIQLTSRGEKFLMDSKASLEKLEGAKQDIIHSSETPRGTLRVTLAGIFGENYIAPVVIKMAKDYPELQIELNFDARIVDLIAEKYDVAIRFGHLPDSSLKAQKIASRREFICASKTYLQANSVIKEPRDLTAHNCLGQGQWTFKKNGKKLQVQINGNLKTNNPRVLLRAAKNGLGIVRLPGSYVFDEIQKGKLVSILEDFSEGKMDIWAVTPTRHEQNINVKTFITEVKKALSEGYPDVLF